MKISYDPKVDALYLQFVDGKHEVTTLRLSEDVAIDCDPKGGVVGMEILSAHEHLKFAGHQPLMQFENLAVEEIAAV
ncbi:MAG: DUF2283 domain-containing protein [Candidatus Coatesbacteria bacterium]|nr:DUF2283 domain-containing protein [Candidatus Coatesbacteria bacterium]